MKSEVTLEWVQDLARYLEIDPNNVQSVTIDGFGVYIYEYVRDSNNLIQIGPNNEPRTHLQAIPVVRGMLDRLDGL